MSLTDHYRHPNCTRCKLCFLARPKPISVALKGKRLPAMVEATLANTRAGTVEACQRTKLTIIGNREFLAIKKVTKVKKGNAAQTLNERPRPPS